MCEFFQVKLVVLLCALEKRHTLEGRRAMHFVHFRRHKLYRKNEEYLPRARIVVCQRAIRKNRKKRQHTQRGGAKSAGRIYNAKRRSVNQPCIIRGFSPFAHSSSGPFVAWAIRTRSSREAFSLVNQIVLMCEIFVLF